MEAVMRTTVTLDEALVRELLEFSKANTKTAAVALAVREQIGREKLKRLAGLLGKVDIDEKAVHEGDKADMRRVQRNYHPANGYLDRSDMPAP
jgi:hypothetical protein